MVPYREFYENANTTDSADDESDASSYEIQMNSNGEITGANWQGDDDNEILFGTMWNDFLQGGGEQDILYGFEGDDTIEGGSGEDRLFGDAGNDTIWTGNAGTVGDVSI